MAPLADSGLLDVNGTLLAEIIAFLVMLALLSRYAFPPIERAATQRQEQIEAGLRAAAEAEKRLAAVREDVESELEKARAQARDVLGRAHAEATADAEEVRNTARREASSILDKARADIDLERDRALQELRAQIGALVVEASGRVLGSAIDAKTHRRLIDEALSEVGAKN